MGLYVIMTDNPLATFLSTDRRLFDRLNFYLRFSLFTSEYFCAFQLTERIISEIPWKQFCKTWIKFSLWYTLLSVSTIFFTMSLVLFTLHWWSTKMNLFAMFVMQLCLRFSFKIRYGGWFAMCFYTCSVQNCTLS